MVVDQKHLFQIYDIPIQSSKLITTNQYFVCQELRQQTLSKLHTQKLYRFVETNRIP